MRLLLIRIVAIILVGVGLLLGLPMPLQFYAVSTNLELESSLSNGQVDKRSYLGDIQTGNSNSPKPAPAPTPSVTSRTIKLETPDGVVYTGITDEGIITGLLSATTADTNFSISIQQGTQIQISNENHRDLLDPSRVGTVIPEEIEVKILDTNNIAPFPEGWIAVSPPYEINGVTKGIVTGLKMDNPALLVIKYDESKLPEKLNDLATFYYDYEMGWTQLEYQEGFVAEGPEVAAEISHFSLFVVLGKSGEVGKPPADIVVQKLSINPTRVSAGQSSEIRVEVTNKGGLPGETNVVLKMNNKIQKTQNVRLEAGQSTEIALVLAPGQNGYFALTAGLASGYLMVDPAETPDVAETDYWWLWCIALGVSILLFTFIRRKQFDEKKEGRN